MAPIASRSPAEIAAPLGMRLALSALGAAEGILQRVGWNFAYTVMGATYQLPSSSCRCSAPCDVRSRRRPFTLAPVLQTECHLSMCVLRLRAFMRVSEHDNVIA